MSTPRADRFDRFSAALTVVVFAALLLPLVVVVVMSFNASNSVSWPPSGFSLQWYAEALDKARVREAALNTLRLGLTTALASTALGTITGFALVRYSFRGRNLTAALVVLPVLVPALLLGLGLVIVLTGLLHLRLSLLTLWVGHVTFTLPFTTLIVASRAVSLDRRLEDASRDLGAGWLRTMVQVVLPPLLPAVRAAFLFSFIISMNEVVLALFLAGTDQTLPGYMFGEFLRVVTPEIDAISTLMVVLAVAVLAIENVAARALLSRREQS
ncbi:MAG: ABC transporter permease [Thermomicrobiales bacterium]|nr:ABC transporter permease [Thermomicrobiales bacterium]